MSQIGWKIFSALSRRETLFAERLEKVGRFNLVSQIKLYFLSFNCQAIVLQRTTVIQHMAMFQNGVDITWIL